MNVKVQNVLKHELPQRASHLRVIARFSKHDHHSRRRRLNARGMEWREIDGM